MYREALGAFAASYERFLEAFVTVVMRSNGIPRSLETTTWKLVKKQSERQLGAFLFLYLLEFKEEPPILKGDDTALRNRAIHEGYFPTKDECVRYGNAVLLLMESCIAKLYHSEKHKAELVGLVNDPFYANTGGNVYLQPWTLVGMNRVPQPGLITVEKMLASAIAAKGKGARSKRR